MKLLAIIAALIAAAYADLSINNPVQSTVWNAGQPATITWLPAGAGLDASKQVQIDLMRGDPNALTLVATLGTTNEGAQSFTYQVPANLPAGSDYVIRVGDRYSGMFRVAGGNGSPSTGTATATGTATGTAAPTGTAKSTATASATSTGTAKPTATPNSGLAVKVSVAAFVPAAALAVQWF